MAWIPADGAAKDDSGNYLALIDGKWQPAQGAAKNDQGQYMAFMADEAKPEPKATEAVDTSGEGALYANPDQHVGQPAPFAPHKDQYGVNITGEVGPNVADQSAPVSAGQIGTAFDKGKHAAEASLASAPEDLKLFHTSGIAQESAAAMSAYDAIDSGKNPNELGKGQYEPGRAYWAASPQERQLMRQTAVQQFSSNKELAQASARLVLQYQQEASQYSGGAPSLLHVKGLGDFTNWLAKTAGSGIASLAPIIAASAANPALGLGVMGAQNVASSTEEAAGNGASSAPMGHEAEAAAQAAGQAHEDIAGTSALNTAMMSVSPFGRYAAGQPVGQGLSLPARIAGSSAEQAGIGAAQYGLNSAATGTPITAEGAIEAAGQGTVLGAAVGAFHGHPGAPVAGVKETPDAFIVSDPLSAAGGQTPLVVPKDEPVIPQRAPTGGDQELLQRAGVDEPVDENSPDWLRKQAEEHEALAADAPPGDRDAKASLKIAKDLRAQADAIEAAKAEPTKADGAPVDVQIPTPFTEREQSQELNNAPDNAAHLRQIADALEAAGGDPAEVAKVRAAAGGEPPKLTRAQQANAAELDQALRDGSKPETIPPSEIPPADANPPKPVEKLKAPDVQASIEQAMPDVAPHVTVVQTLADLPQEAQKYVANGSVTSGNEGFSVNGHAYLIADHIAPVTVSGREVLTAAQNALLTAHENAIQIAAHEVEHVGERADSGVGIDQMTRVLQAADTNDTVSRLADEIMRREKITNRAIGLREALARLAGARVLGDKGDALLYGKYGVRFSPADAESARGLAARLFQHFKEFLASIGVRKLSDTDVLRIMLRHRDAAVATAKDSERIRTPFDKPALASKMDEEPDESIDYSKVPKLDNLDELWEPSDDEIHQDAVDHVFTQTLAREFAKTFRMSRRDGSLGDEDYEHIGRAWQSIADHNDVFTYPKSNAKKMPDILSDMGGGKMTVDEHKATYERNMFLRGDSQEMDDVLDAYGIRHFAPKTVYTFERKLTDEESRKIGQGRNRPVTAHLYSDGEHAVLSIPSFKEGVTEGNLVYQVCASFCHNNGIKFIGDPQGLSKRALVRRAENLMSSALRHHSTDYFAPHPYQEEAGLKWKPGKTEYNIGLTAVWLHDILKGYDPHYLEQDTQRVPQERGPTTVGTGDALAKHDPVLATAARQAVLGGARTRSRVAVTGLLKRLAAQGGLDESQGNLTPSASRLLLNEGVVGGPPDGKILYSRRDEGKDSGAVRPELVAKARAIFEVAPDPGNKALTERWRTLDDQGRLDISRQVANDVIPKVLRAAGVRGEIQDQIGSYGDDTNPSFSVEVDDPRKLMDVAHLAGYAMSQESTMGISQRPFAGGEPVEAVTVDLPRTVTMAYVRQIYDILREIEVDGNKPISGQTTVNGEMAILNYSGLPTEQLAKLVDDKLGGKYDVNVDTLHAAFPTKEDYNYDSDRPQGQATAPNPSLRDSARSLRAAATESLGARLDAAAPRGGDQGGQGNANEAARSEQPAGDVLASRKDYADSALKVMRGEETKLAKGKNGQVNNHAVAKHFDELARKETGRELSPENDADLGAAHDQAVAEIREQLKEERSGKDWYDEDIDRAWEIAHKRFPELTHEDHQTLFATMAAIMSPSVEPHDNWSIASRAYEHLLDTGTIPGRNPDNGQLWMGGPVSRNKMLQLNMLDAMVKDKGIAGTAAWLRGEHSVKELNEARETYSDMGPGVDGKMTETKVGFRAFGPKVGPFVMNIHGRNEETVDRWMTRTWNRYFGKMTGPDGKIIDSPTEAERVKIKRFLKAVGSTTDLKSHQAQAVLWFFEQRLFNKLGTGAKSYGFSDGAKKYADLTEGKPRVGRGPEDDGQGYAAAGRHPQQDNGSGMGALASLREEAEGPAELIRGPGRERDTGWSGNPRQEDASVVDGIHYGKNNVPALSGNYFGSGIKGAEAERLKYASDPRLTRRVYFYTQDNHSDLPSPEPGLGAHVYYQRLGNMYDAEADPRDLSEKVRSISDPMDRRNAYESSVLNEGFDGYHHNGVAVVLNQSVPVKKLGMTYDLKGKTHGPDSERTAAAPGTDRGDQEAQGSQAQGKIRTPFSGGGQAGTGNAAGGRNDGARVGDVLASRKDDGIGFDIPDETLQNKTARKFQDAYNRVRIIQDAIGRQGGTVDDSNDVYMAQQLAGGRKQAAAEELKRQWLEPLMRKLAGAGLTPDDLSLYAYAMHAPERNAYIDTINPKMNGAGSGMSNADSRAILDRFNAEGKTPELQDAHQSLLGLTAATRRILLDEGLITPEQHDAMERQYSNYVPLKGLEKVDDVGAPVRGGARGINVRGDETMRALGRRSRASDIIENAVLDYERAVNRGEDNAVGKTLLKLVLDNPDKDLWEANAVKQTRGIDPMSGLVENRQNTDKGDDTVGVKLAGKTVYVKLHDPVMARSLLGAAADDYGPMMRGFIHGVNYFNGLVRNTATHWNPVFPLRHTVRAFQRANATLMSDLGTRGTALFNRHYASSMASALRYETGTLDPTNPADRSMLDYRAAGGLTGSGYMRSLEDVQGEIHNVLSRAGASVKPALGAVGRAAQTLMRTPGLSHAWQLTSLAARGIESAVKIGENGTRAAAFRAAKEVGLSDKRAAQVARNVITDFGRKGEWGPLLNSMYLFYNAAIQEGQGVARILKNPRVQGLLAAYTGLAATLAMTNSNVGGTDEDGVPFWDKIPEYEKNMNQIIMMPPKADESGKLRARYIKVPSAYGLNVFNTLGNAITDVYRHSVDPKTGHKPIHAAVNMVNSVRGSFDPVAHDLDMTTGPGFLQAIAPTFADLPIQLATETNFTGQPTAPAADSTKPVPNSERYFQSQYGTYPQRVAQVLNRMSGGDQFRSGAVDLTPGSIKTAVDTLGGQTGKFMADAASWAQYLHDPSGTAEPRSTEAPWKAFYGQTDERTTGFEYNAEIQSISKDYKQSLEAIKSGKAVDFGNPDNVNVIQMGTVMDETNKVLGEIHAMRTQIVDSDTMTDAEKAEQLKALSSQQEQMRQMFNRQYREVFGSER